MDIIVQIVKEVGFPVFVSLYLLVIMRKAIEELRNALEGLKSTVKEMNESNIILKGELLRQSETFRQEIVTCRADIVDLKTRIENCQKCHIPADK